MNLAHFYSMIQFSGQKGSTSKKTATATATATTTTNEAATTTTLTKATTTTSASLSAPTKTTKISTTASATTNQLPPTIMTAATAAVGYSNGILYLPHDTINININNNNNSNSNIIGNIINNHVVGDEGHEEDEDEQNDETDSLASMETLSDNVSIWVDGEKHWVSGVDANTTCRDLINALLNYQDGPQMCSSNNSNNKGDNTDNIDGIDSSNKAGGNSAINQSTLNTKEDEATAAGAAVAVVVHEADDAQKHRNADAFNNNDRRTCSNDAATYVIVRQHRHCEEFLDGNTKVFDLLPATRDAAGRREHQQLYLRRLTLASHVAGNAPGLGSLLSTDKDSGMGSPVGSSRSARLRRKKHKSTVSWLAQGNTLHPKLSQRGSAANERLLKIILAQDETIHRQLTLLREKERQISKIEEEKHRTRERELGKNYLLETYLNGLDEAGTGDVDDVVEGEEIFIDEPFVDYTRTTTTATATKAIKQQQHQQERKSKRSSRHSKQPATQNKKEAAAAATRTTTKSVTTTIANDTPASVAGSHNDLEQQILWMEKLCSINKQLQREEELLLKLHSKIRKHHVKRAYHRKQQMLQQLDDLDSNISLQAVDIRKNEADLAASDEQLQQKASLLERLSLELEADVCAEQQQKQTVLATATTAIITASPITSPVTMADVDLQQPGYQQLVPPASSATSKAERSTLEAASATAALTIAATEIATAAAAAASASAATRATTSTSEPRTRFTLDGMQLPEDLLSWQQLIAKPQVLSTTPTTAAATMATGSKAATVAAVATTAVVSATNAATNYEQRINHASNATKNCSSDVALQLQQRHQQQQQQQQQQQHLNDKLHALHMKTVKKQMFSPKAVVSNAPVVGVPPSAAAPVCRPPPTQPQSQPQPTLLFLADTLDFTQIGTLV